MVHEQDLGKKARTYVSFSVDSGRFYVETLQYHSGEKHAILFAAARQNADKVAEITGQGGQRPLRWFHYDCWIEWGKGGGPIDTGLCGEGQECGKCGLDCIEECPVG